jgi:hypothetical protein
MKLRKHKHDMLPMEEEFMNQIAKIITALPSSRDDAGHFKTKRISYSPEMFDIIDAFKENTPEDWHANDNQYMRMIIGMGIYTYKTFLEYRDRVGPFVYEDVKMLDLLMSCWKAQIEGEVINRNITLAKKFKKMKRKGMEVLARTVVGIFDKNTKKMSEASPEFKKEIETPDRK